MQAKLDALRRELDRPGQFRGRLSELEAVVRMLESQPAGQERYRVADPASLKQVLKVRPRNACWSSRVGDGSSVAGRRWSTRIRVAQVLNEQQDGLAKLTQVLKDDMEAMAIMLRGLEGTPGTASTRAA